MKVRCNNGNKYIKDKTLYVDKNTGNPIKMEVRDINKNIRINILYKEVKINELEENNIVAFNLYGMNAQI